MKYLILDGLLRGRYYIVETEAKPKLRDEFYLDLGNGQIHLTASVFLWTNQMEQELLELAKRVADFDASFGKDMHTWIQQQRPQRVKIL